MGYLLSLNHMHLLVKGITSSSGQPRQSKFDRFAFQKGNQRGESPLDDAQVDILRCLEIGDSDAKQGTTETMEIDVVQIGTFPSRRNFYFKKWRTFYETIKPSQVFNLKIRLKSAIINHSDARTTLGWTNATQDLQLANLPKIINQFALRTVEHELDYLETVPSARNLANAVHTKYLGLKRQVQSALKAENGTTCYLCIGRGGGRHKRTVELAIADPNDPNLRFNLYGGKRANGRLGDGGRGKGLLGYGDVRSVERGKIRARIAPVSRVFTISGPNVAKSPLGWVKLTFGEGFEAVKDEVIPIPNFQP